MEVIIAKASIEDLDQIYQFERKYILEHEPYMISKWDGIRSKTKKTLMENLSRIFVAVSADELVGHGYWAIHEGYPCIYSLYVLNDYRGQGIGHKLMLSIEESIISNGYNKMKLSTLESNQARHLFDKMAYSRIALQDGWIHYEKSICETNQ